ncbi:protein MIS12 homolog [Belonocnema kinseyi]|uniref:protein MIS12 homolog n=1 Tax=Belonocnema kinseyi TaxID=2817044 RepID=UPI00143D4305|nr:protein MIS12 homolog [Belonocnema kinseyi]
MACLRKRKREEYEMQLFGFHSRTVYATLKDVVESKIKSRCRNLYEALEKKYQPDEEGKATLKANIKELRKAYIQGAQPYLKNIEKIVEKYIAVPDNVLLEEDKCQAVQYTDEEFKELNDKLESLQNRMKRAQMLNAVLNQELEATKEIDEFEESLEKVFEVIEKGLNFPEPDTEVLQVVETYKNLCNVLEIMTSKTEKQTYNPNLGDIKLKELDFDNL